MGSHTTDTPPSNPGGAGTSPSKGIRRTFHSSASERPVAHDASRAAASRTASGSSASKARAPLQTTIRVGCSSLHQGKTGVPVPLDSDLFADTSARRTVKGERSTRECQVATIVGVARQRRWQALVAVLFEQRAAQRPREICGPRGNRSRSANALEDDPVGGKDAHCMPSCILRTCRHQLRCRRFCTVRGRSQV